MSRGRVVYRTGKVGRRGQRIAVIEDCVEKSESGGGSTVTGGDNDPQAAAIGIEASGIFQGQIAAEQRQPGRITSYNVCYTKLLR